MYKKGGIGLWTVMEIKRESEEIKGSNLYVQVN